MGKHIYLQKPLTHSVYESRLLTKLAEKYKVATSMGNQGSSGEGVNLTTEWIQNGEIGEIRRVEAFTDRPIWPQGLERPKEKMTAPDTLNWDLFIGPAPMRPYHRPRTPISAPGIFIAALLLTAVNGRVDAREVRAKRRLGGGHPKRAVADAEERDAHRAAQEARLAGPRRGPRRAGRAPSPVPSV